MVDKYIKPEAGPLFTRNQVAFLEQKYPVKILPVSATVDEIRRYFGQQEVVEMVRRNS